MSMNAEKSNTKKMGYTVKLPDPVVAMHHILLGKFMETEKLKDIWTSRPKKNNRYVRGMHTGLGYYKNFICFVLPVPPFMVTEAALLVDFVIWLRFELAHHESVKGKLALSLT